MVCNHEFRELNNSKRQEVGFYCIRCLMMVKQKRIFINEKQTQPQRPIPPPPRPPPQQYQQPRQMPQQQPPQPPQQQPPKDNAANNLMRMLFG